MTAASLHAVRLMLSALEVADEREKAAAILL